MVDELPRIPGRYPPTRPPIPLPVLLTAVAFALLAVLFGLAVVLGLLVADGTVAAAVFFGVFALTCATVAAGLLGRRRWAAPAAYAVAALLAAASLGLFGAITVVGLGFAAWVSWALRPRRSAGWFRR